MNGLGLDSKIVFKVKLEEEIKKIVIHNEDINFNELLLMMQRIFSDRIKPNDEFSIKYTDEENDLITMANDSDVSLALQNNNLLKLTLFLKESEEVPENIKPAEIVKELKSIRCGIDRFLEKFERSLKFEQTKECSQQTSLNDSSNIQVTTNGHGIPASNSSHNVVLNNDSHKEFDPLTKRPEPVEASKIGTQTPDSMNSLELSASQKNFERLRENDESYSQASHPIVQPQAQTPHMQMPMQNQGQTFPNVQGPSTMKPNQPIQQQFQGQQFPQGLQGPQGPQAPQGLQGPQGFKNIPQPQSHYQMQQYYQQQQQNQSQPSPHSMLPQSHNFNPSQQQPQGTQQQPAQPMMGQAPSGMYQSNQNQGSNPYAKPPNAALVRPPSATQFYQQGYK